MTTNPFVNNLTDFIPIINILHGKIIVDTTQKNGADYVLSPSNDPEALIGNLRIISKLLHNRIHFYMQNNDADFPKRIDHKILVKMDSEYYKRYGELMAEKDDDNESTHWIEEFKPVYCSIQ